jgi:mannose-6-phosphate isomerase-like protein (cupin superfamily)
MAMDAVAGGGLQAMDGEARWWFGGLATIKFDGAATGGRFSIADMRYPSGIVVPVHVHLEADEVFQVLEGRMQFTIGDRQFVAEPGATVFMPRGVPHGFTVLAPGPVHYVITYTPAGFEGFIRDTSEPAPRRELPPPMTGAPDPDVLARMDALMADRYRTIWYRPAST